VARAALKVVKERKAKERQQSKLSSNEGKPEHVPRSRLSAAIEAIKKNCHEEKYGTLRDFENDFSAIRESCNVPPDEWAAIDTFIRPKIEGIRTMVEKVDPSARRR
jgi:hypothetical protein